MYQKIRLFRYGTCADVYSLQYSHISQQHTTQLKAAAPSTKRRCSSENTRFAISGTLGIILRIYVITVIKVWLAPAPAPAGRVFRFLVTFCAWGLLWSSVLFSFFFQNGGNSELGNHIHTQCHLKPLNLD